MIETEYKCIIDEQTYDKIREHFDWDWEVHQINNYYFDAKGELSKRHIMVRIREKNGAFAVQVKAHKNPGEALQICEENEFPIDCVPEVIPAADALKYTGVETGDLKLAGDLDTLRSSLMWRDNVEICLDKSAYLDRVDYEIEIEYTGDLPVELMRELEGLGVVFKKSAVGKYTRFVTRLFQLLHGDV